MKRQTRIKLKIKALQEGKDPQIDLLDELRDERIGDVPGPDLRVVLGLAREYQRAEDPNYVCVSWSNQIKAQNKYNELGFCAALDELLTLESKG